MKTKTFR